MDRNKIRLSLKARISELRKARDRAGATDAEKDAANEAIKALQDARDRLNSEADQELIGSVNRLVTQLEKVRTENNLDALSALGVAAKKIRGLVEDGPSSS